MVSSRAPSRTVVPSERVRRHAFREQVCLPDAAAVCHHGGALGFGLDAHRVARFETLVPMRDHLDRNELQRGTLGGHVWRARLEGVVRVVALAASCSNPNVRPASSDVPSVARSASVPAPTSIERGSERFRAKRTESATASLVASSPTTVEGYTLEACGKRWLPHALRVDARGGAWDDRASYELGRTELAPYNVASAWRTVEPHAQPFNGGRPPCRFVIRSWRSRARC